MGLRVVREGRTELEVEVLRLEELRRGRDEAEQAYREQCRLVMRLMRSKTATVSDDDGTVRVTKVHARRSVLDEEKLRRSLGARVWDRLTTRVLDHAKLDLAIADGTVDPVVVATCVNTTKRLPYIRVTRKAVKDA
jgi:hypothetical protein